MAEAPAVENTSAPAPAPAAAEAKAPRQPTISAEALLIRAMKAPSAEALEAYLLSKSFSPSRNLLRKTQKLAEADDVAVPALDALIEARGIGGTRGRSSPKVGEKRIYSVQALPKHPSHTFLRVPMDTLSTAKGVKVTVSFKGDIIVIRKKKVAVEGAPTDAPESAEETTLEAVEDQS